MSTDAPAVSVAWWGSRRGDGNRARSALQGRGTRPLELAAVGTGADVRFAQEVALSRKRFLLVHAGSTLQLLDWEGKSRWELLTKDVERVIVVEEQPTSGPPFVVIAVGEGQLEMVDLATGGSRWTWSGPPGTHLTAAGSTVAQRIGDAHLLVCFPTYATRAYCFDLCAGSAPTLRWERDFDATYDAGFGPVAVIADPLDVGRPCLLMSTRTGTQYETEGTAVSTDKLVLGREDGHLYQAVLDLDDGSTLGETSYRPDPGPYPCARPYGLLTVRQLSPDAPPDVILVSCQVEEYIAVTKTTDGALSRRWGHFVEKDWPIDVQELRPQTTSLSDVRGDGNPLLVVGHWHNDEWNTVLIDPRRGWLDGEVARLPGRYFWGCHDLNGDGVPEIVVSVEPMRIPSTSSTVEVIDGRTLEVAASFDDCQVLASTDSDLPSGTTFHAQRAECVAVPDAHGRRGLLLRHSGRTSWWTLGSEGPDELVLLDERAVRVDHRRGRLLLTTASGTIVRYDDDLRSDGSVAVLGRSAEPLSIRAADQALVVAECGDKTVAGWRFTSEGRLEQTWRIPGTLPALHVDRTGAPRLAVVRAIGDRQEVVGFTLRPGGPPTEDFVTPVPATPHDLLAFGDDFRLTVNMRTGVHTAGLLVMDSCGVVLWSDMHHGAHPNRPGAFSRDRRDWLVAYDDHGELFVRDAESGALITTASWTAAYTTPVAPIGGDILIRADGVHGVEALRLDGTPAWRNQGELWSHYPGESALLDTEHGPILCSVTRSGRVEAVRAADGCALWTTDVGQVPSRRPVVALDVDGDGEDELVIGCADGRLECLRADGMPIDVPGWPSGLGAQIQGLGVADIDGDGAAEILVATADGHLRILSV